MDPLITPIVVLLGKYAIDKGIALAREVGPKAVEKAGELFALALDRLRRDKGDAIAGEFERDPDTYHKPVEKALSEAAQLDPNFAAQLKSLFEQYQREAPTVYQASLKGAGAIAQGPGAVAAGAGGVAIGGSARDSVIVTGSNISGDFVRGDKVMGDKIGQQVNTRGGAYVGGDVSVSGGEFVGRDKISYGPGSSVEDTRSRLTAEGKTIAGLLEDYFNEDELRDIGYQLKCDWDRLSGDNLHTKVGALVEYCERRDIVPQLKAVMRLARPQLRRQLK